jgi:hypothetical protein
LLENAKVPTLQVKMISTFGVRAETSMVVVWWLMQGLTLLVIEK